MLRLHYFIIYLYVQSISHKNNIIFSKHKKNKYKSLNDNAHNIKYTSKRRIKGSVGIIWYDLPLISRCLDFFSFLREFFKSNFHKSSWRIFHLFLLFFFVNSIKLLDLVGCVIYRINVFSFLSGVYTGSVYKDYGLLKSGFPAENVSNSSVLVIKTHEWGPRSWTQFSKSILLVRDPEKAILAEFNRQSGGHVGFASPDRYKRTKGRCNLNI